MIGDMLLNGVGLRPPFPFRQQRPAAIAGDRQNPGLQRTLTIPVMQTADNAHEGLLGHIFGFVVLSHHPEAERIHFMSK